jgi:hypothetical protein
MPDAQSGKVNDSNFIRSLQVKCKCFGLVSEAQQPWQPNCTGA